MTQSPKSLEEMLRLVRDAGAMDDNMGGSDWRASDLAITKALASINQLVLDVIGEDVKVKLGHKIKSQDDYYDNNLAPNIQNQLKAEQRHRLTIATWSKLKGGTDE